MLAVTEINIISQQGQFTWSILIFLSDRMYQSSKSDFKWELKVKLMSDSACSLFLMQTDVAESK